MARRSPAQATPRTRAAPRHASTASDPRRARPPGPHPISTEEAGTDTEIRHRRRTLDGHLILESPWEVQTGCLQVAASPHGFAQSRRDLEKGSCSSRSRPSFRSLSHRDRVFVTSSNWSINAASGPRTFTTAAGPVSERSRLFEPESCNAGRTVVPAAVANLSIVVSRVRVSRVRGAIHSRSRSPAAPGVPSDGEIAFTRSSPEKDAAFRSFPPGENSRVPILGSVRGGNQSCAHN